MTTENPVTPAFVLAIDHRFDLFAEVLNTDQGNPSAAHRESAADLKQAVFEGLLNAVERRLPKSQAAVWTDSDLGEAILLRARSMSLSTMMSIERSGTHEFHFEDALGFSERLKQLGASFGAARVPYNPGDDEQANESQRRKLRRLTEICASIEPGLVLELAVPPTESQISQAGSRDEWDRDMRPGLTLETMRQLQDAGAEPDFWVTEAVDDARTMSAIAAQAHVDGRVTGLLLAVGNRFTRDPETDAETGRRLASMAARTAGVDGLVVGPAAYQSELKALHAGQLSREQAVASISARYADLCEAFTQARSASGVV
ncbi:MAG: 2-deoxy-5-keto-D-gluconate 6-phosphate aldolase domain-containing protein [Chloroflexota bacterium]